MSASESYITTHTRHDPGHVLAPGLFRALKRGKRPALRIEYEHGDHYLRWWGPEALGADDLRILQGLIAVAGLRGRWLWPEPVTEAGRAVREGLEVEGQGLDAIAVRTTIHRLLLEIGQHPGGDQRRVAIACLDRLAAVTIIEQRGRERWSSRVLSYRIDTETGELLVGLNPRIARAVAGVRHTRISMKEVRALAGASSAARLLHQRLCGVVDPGGMRRIGIDALCRYVWPEHESAAAPARRQHRCRVRDALREIADLAEWSCRVEGRDQWVIRRKKSDTC